MFRLRALLLSGPVIEIDDAGCGNLVGGIVIGAYRPGDPPRYESRLIGPDLFDGNGAVRAAAAEAVASLVASLDGDGAEVVLCTSDVFDAAAAALASAGRPVRRAAIGGPLQDLVEADFIAHLRRLGLPAHVERIASLPSKDLAYRSLNDFSTKYVLVDRIARAPLCKRGTRHWRRLSTAAVEVSEIDLRCRRPGRLCHNCGGRVITGPARRYRLGRTVFYTHVSC